MCLDTSALVAILAGEPDRAELLDRIEAAPIRYVSALAILEGVMRLTTKFQVEPEDAHRIVQKFLGETETDILAIEPQTAALAVAAFSRFGKGRGHPAQLNVADCMSYACAKSRNVPLLYKGNNFAQTDLA